MQFSIVEEISLESQRISLNKIQKKVGKQKREIHGMHLLITNNQILGASISFASGIPFTGSLLVRYLVWKSQGRELLIYLDFGNNVYDIRFDINFGNSYDTLYSTGFGEWFPYGCLI